MSDHTSDPSSACPDADVLVALALGELTGRARAEALTHLAACRTCQTQVGELTDTVDRLLLVAPSAEPPPGFDVAVLDRATAARARRRRRVAGAHTRSPRACSPSLPWHSSPWCRCARPGSRRL